MEDQYNYYNPNENYNYGDSQSGGSNGEQAGQKTSKEREKNPATVCQKLWQSLDLRFSSALFQV